MKQWLFIIGLLTLVSCDEQSSEPMPDKGGEIKFAQQLVSKAVPITSATIADMGVFAYYTGDGDENKWVHSGATTAPNIMNNYKVAKLIGKTWISTPVAYWPFSPTANTTFFAYAPMATAENGVTITNTTGEPQITYTVPTDINKQVDLLVAQPLKDIPNGTTVAFTFEHALTMITFRIKQVKLSALNLTAITLTSVDGSTVKLMNSIRYNLNDVTIPLSPTFPAENSIKFTAMQSIDLQTDVNLTLPPMPLASDSDPSALKVKFEFDNINYKGGEYTVYLKDAIVNTNQYGFRQGSQYIYNLTIDNHFKFDDTPSLGNWTTGDDIVVEI